MDEETKKAILETRDILADLLAMMKEQKALAEARERNGNPEVLMKGLISSLPEGLQKAMNSFGAKKG